MKIDLYITQAKNKSNLEEEVINKLIVALEELLNLNNDINEFDDYYGKPVIELIQRFRSVYQNLVPSYPEVNITIVYASKGGEPTDNMKRKSETLCKKLQDLFIDAQIDFIFLGAPQLIKLDRKQPKQTVKLKISDGPIIAGSTNSFVFLVNLRGRLKSQEVLVCRRAKRRTKRCTIVA